MKKIGDVTSTADKNGEWTNGNVAAGIAPTILEAGWLNSVQREILGVLVEAGIAQDKNNDNQLKDAIKKIISGGNYATKTEVNSKLAKDQNGADIPNKDTFIKNLGLPERYQPKGNYQPAGDYPLTSSVFGIGQKWQDVTKERQGGVVYNNNTGRPICVFVRTKKRETPHALGVGGTVQGIAVGGSWAGANGQEIELSCFFIVPPGHNYSADSFLGNSGNFIGYWSELR